MMSRPLPAIKVIKLRSSRHFLGLIVIGLFAVLLTLFHNRTQAKRLTPLEKEYEVPRDTAVLPGSALSTPAIADSKRSFATQQTLFITAFETPIAFYGRVVDQNGNPVDQADIKLSANDKAFGGRPSEYARKTDGNGAFSIDGIHGITLAVEVSKLGYQVIPSADNRATSSGVFEYGLSSIRGPHRANKDSPVIFALRKRGTLEPLSKIGEKNFRIARDGSPLVISLNLQQTHQIILRCWTSDASLSEGQHHYDWRLEITVSNGGLVIRNDAMDFEAPEGGYVSSDIIEMPASLPRDQWSSSAERSYFIRFDDLTFARANLRMKSGGDHFVVWESFLNPKLGSRNLEYDASQRASVR